MTDTNTLKVKLTELKNELNTRINAIKSQNRQTRSLDSSDAAIEAENDQVLESLRVEAEEELIEINDALNRLEKGQYGICVQCQAPIEPQRLDAIPFTRSCINCAQ